MEDKKAGLAKLLEGLELVNSKTETNETPDQSKKSGKKISIEQCLALYKVMLTMKMMKEDKNPVEILEGLYIGTFAASKNKEGLLNNKISHILVVASSLKANFPEEFTYKSIDILDSPEANLKLHFDQCGDFIHNCLTNQGRILVHWYYIYLYSFAGKSRSSSIIIAYLIKYKSMTYEKAYELVKSKRDLIQPNEGFVKQLKEYHAELEKNN